MAFDVDGARKAGYSDDEIAGFLSEQSGFDLAGARAAGYAPADVIGFLSTAAKPEPADKLNLGDPMGTGGSEIMAAAAPPSAGIVEQVARPNMLQQGFVDTVRNEVIGSLPAEKRLPALKELARAPGAYGIAAREILGDVEQENAYYVGKEANERQARKINASTPVPAAGRPRMAEGGRAAIVDATPGFADMARGDDEAAVAKTKTTAGILSAAQEGARKERQTTEARLQQPRTAEEWISDSGVYGKQGWALLRQVIANSVDPSSEWSAAINAEMKGLDAELTEKERFRREEVAKRVSGTDSEIRRFAIVLAEMANPTIGAQEIIKQLPLMASIMGLTIAGGVTGGLVVRGASAAFPTVALADAIGGGGITAAGKLAGGLVASRFGAGVAAGGDAAQGVYEELTSAKNRPLMLQNPDVLSRIGRGMSEDQAIKEVATNRARIAQGLAGAVGAALGGMGLEGQVARKVAGKATGDGAAKAFGKELSSELADELSTQAATNWQVGQVDPSRKITEGFGETAATTFVTTLPMAATSAVMGHQETNANPVDQAIAASRLSASGVEFGATRANEFFRSDADVGPAPRPQGARPVGDPVAAIQAAPTVDDAIRTAARAIDQTIDQTQNAGAAAAVDNIARILGTESTNVGSPAAVPGVAAPAGGSGAVDAAAGVGTGVGTAGVVRPAVDAGSVGSQASGGAVPLGAGQPGALSFAQRSAGPVQQITVTPAGTVTAVGDPQALMRLLKAAGVTSVIPSKDGITVGKSQATMARKILDDFVAAPPENFEQDFTKELEQAYQADIKQQILQRRGAPVTQAPKPAASAFKNFLREVGIAAQIAKDIVGEGAFRSSQVLARTFRANGLNVDLLAQQARERGFLTDADINNPDDIGGTRKLVEMIQAEIRGERATSMDMAEETQGAILDRRAVDDVMARAAAIGFDASGMEPGQVDAALKRIERRLAKNRAAGVQREAADEARIEREAIQAADRLAAEPAKIMDEVLDVAENASLEDAMRALGFTEQEISDAVANESRSAQADRQVAGGAVEAPAGAAQGSAARGEGQARGQEGEGVGGESLDSRQVRRSGAANPAPQAGRAPGNAGAAAGDSGNRRGNPEGARNDRPQDLLGEAPNASQQEAARLRAEREAQQRRQQQQAPDAADFQMSGSDRAVDVGAAAGQRDLLAGAPDAGLSAADTQTVVATFRANGLDIKVADTQDDLPESAQRRMLSEGISGVRGLYDPATDTTWIVRSNLGSKEEAFFVGLHEAFHRGLGRTFGRDINAILGYIELNNKSVRDKAREYRDTYKMGRYEAIEEVLADMAGEGKASDLRGWDRLLAFLRQVIQSMARGIGVNIPVTDAMVEQLVAGIRKEGMRDTPAFVVQSNKGPMFLRVFHGTPHEVDRFSTDKIGTGEGTQAYGWGIYLASSRDVAEHYRKSVSDRLGRGFSIAGYVPTSPNEGLSNDEAVATKDLAELLVPNPEVVQTFGSLNVVGQGRVLGVVRRLLQNRKILDTVIPLVPVDVVNMLGGQKRSSNGLLDNPAMLVDLFPGNANDFVASDVQAMNVLAPLVAIAAAKVHTGAGRFDVTRAAVERAAADTAEQDQGDLQKLHRKIPQPSEFAKGNLYEVDIPEDGEYLLWDKPLSEQPEGVSKALTSDTATMAALEEDQFGGPVMDQVTGRDFYRALSRRLGGDRQASEYLRSLGIRGIKYLDGASRNTGDGTFNYVIFDDADVEIAARFSRPTSGQEISPGPEFWRKIRAGEPMSPEEIANAYAQGTRSAAPRTFAGMAGASDRQAAIPGTEHAGWRGEVAGFEDYVTVGVSTPDGALAMGVVPRDLYAGARAARTTFEGVRDHSLATYVFRPREDGSFELGVVDPPEGSPVFDELQRRGYLDLTPYTDGNGTPYYRVPIGYAQNRAFLQEAIRRLGLHIGDVPEIKWPRRETGARGGIERQQPSTLSRDTVSAKFSRRFSSLRGSRPTASYVDATPRQQATLDAIDEGPESTDFDLLPAKEDINQAADAAFTDWEQERGIKYVPLNMIGPLTGYNIPKDAARIRRLADAIKESNTFEPIFVGIDPNGEAYIMEGQHRARALQLLGETHVPAQVIVSMEGSDDDYAAQPEAPPAKPTDYKLAPDQMPMFSRRQDGAEPDRTIDPWRVDLAPALSTAMRRWEAGRATDADLAAAVRAELDNRKAKREEATDRDRVRGADWLQERILRARRTGEMSTAEADLALWLLNRAPQVATDLGISIKSGDMTKPNGTYNVLERVVTSLTSKSNPDTLTHEILHHTERMMPEPVQNAIRKEWLKQLETEGKKVRTGLEQRIAQAEADPRLKRAVAADQQRIVLLDWMLEASRKGDADLASSLYSGFRDGISLKQVLPYELSSPSEFWAVNAAALVRKRAETGTSLWRQARQWLIELVQKAKSMLGLRSNAPVIRGLEAVLAGDGSFVTRSMIASGMREVEDQTDSDAFLAWFKDSKVVDAEGKPLVVYHGTASDFDAFQMDAPLRNKVRVLATWAASKIDGSYSTRRAKEKATAFFTSDPALASDYAASFGDAAAQVVMPTYLSLQRPVVMDFTTGVLTKPDGSTFDIGRIADAAVFSNEALIDIARQSRADGVVMRGVRDDAPNGAKRGSGDVFIVFRPEQVKSATGNRGTFDPANPNIMFARATANPTQAGTPAALTPQTSPWRDETGRLRFLPGAWLYEKFGPEVGGAVMGGATGAAAGPVGAVVGAVAGAASARLMLNRLELKAASPALRRALREMKIQVAKAQETAAAVATEAMKLTEAERGMVSDLIEQEMAAGTVPPQHAVRLAAMINATMGAQTDELVRLGMLSSESAEMWRGKYLPRFYESKLRNSETMGAWADALRQLTGRPKTMAGIKGKHLRGRGMYETIPEAELPQWEQMGWEVRDPDYQPGLTEDGTVQVWRDFTRQERDSMGEIRDAGFRFVMGYMQTQRDIALGRMFEALAADPAMSSKRETEEFSVMVPDSTVPGTGAKRYGKLAGRRVSKDTLSHLSAIEEAQSEVWRMYRKALATWKEGKTSMNPVSHVNNVVSNLTMAHLAGVSYLRADKYIGAARDFATNAPGIQEAKDAGLFLGTMSDAELMQVLPEDLKALVRKQDSTATKVGRSAFNVMTFFLRRPMGWAYQAEDTFFRYLIYKDARERGLEPADAVDYAQKYIFTYDDLPKGARMIRDFGIPFFSYTFKAVPALLHTAMTHPLRMAMPAALLWAANAAAYAIAFGGDDDDSWEESLKKYLTDGDFRNKVRQKEKLEREHLPPWMKGTTALLTPKTVRLGMDEVTKLPVFIDVSRIIPGGDLFDVSPNAGGIPLPQPVTPSHPLFTTAVAMLGNKDLFFGKELVDANDTRGEATLKRMDWMWKQMTPAIALGNYHFERGMNALAQATGEEIRWMPEAIAPDAVVTGIGRDGLPVQPRYAAMQTFGIKARPIDLEMAEDIGEGQKNKMLREIDAEIRRLQRLNMKGAVADSVMNRKRDQAQVKKDRIRDNLTVDGEERP